MIMMTAILLSLFIGQSLVVQMKAKLTVWQIDALNLNGPPRVYVPFRRLLNVILTATSF